MSLPVSRSELRHIHVVDSHTGGEPTRVIVSGGPDLGDGDLVSRLALFREQHDDFRSVVVNEPRGSDVLVGALLTEASDPSCAAGVIFFNNVGYLGMCGHGMMGVVATLAYLGRLTPGSHRIQTPVGGVTVELHESGDVSVRNVASYRVAKDVAVAIKGHGTIHGDVAWGGNGFFLCEDHGQALESRNVAALTDFSWRVRRALEGIGVTGRDGAPIDHVELFAPSQTPGVRSRSFVLCPGGAYDRSPCGTGTSAKLACLYEDGKLREGEVWRQESIIGSVFDGWVEVVDGTVVPTVRGRAYVTGESTLICDPLDPFCWGIR